MDGADRRRLWAISLVWGFMSAALSATRPIVPLWAREFGAEPGLIGLVVSVYGLIPLFLAIPAGLLADRIDLRRLSVTGSVGAALSLGLLVLFPNFATLVVAQLLLGIFQLLSLMATQTTITRIGTTADREKTLGIFSSVGATGQLIGPLLGGVTVDALAYPGAYGLGVLLSLGSLAAALLTRPPGPPKTAARSAGPPAPERGRTLRLLRNPAIQIAIISSFSLIFSLGVWETFLPLYMNDLGYSTSLIGAVLSVRSVANISSRFFMKQLSDWVGTRFRLLIASMAAGAITIGLTITVISPWAIAGLAILAGIASGLVFPLGLIAVADGVSPDERGLAMGMRLTGNRLAQLTNPIVFGLAIQWAGLAAAFYAGGLLLLIVSLLILPYARHYPEYRPEVHDELA